MLRAPARDDAARLCALANDIEVARMTCSLPHPFGPAEAEAAIARAGAPEAPGFAIEHPQEGLIGMISFKAGRNGAPEIGYWLGRPYWGYGYATEAARAALSWARGEWKKKVVLSGHFSDNPASGQVLCKAGFLYTGDVELRHSKARGEAAPTRLMVWLA
jgi:RimJ/RimL family protein N-acetyltransferase